ncbi:MAG TPA: cupin domain-containing protein [Anaerolineae bacterium]|nr:cupin domain-containing protein [Anaerolineae bacterium]
MTFLNLDEIEARELLPGLTMRCVHSEGMTLVYWEIEAGAEMPLHDHPHEQVANVLEGELQLTVQGETRILKPGQVAVIGSNVPHAGKAITDCRVLDVFHPVREDYR